MRRLLSDAKIPLTDRIRIANSAGALFGTLMGVGEDGIFGSIAPEEVAERVRRRGRPVPETPAAEPRTRR